MTTTDAPIACPLCRAEGSHEQPHGLDISHRFWSCCRCGWKFIVNADGSTRHWLNPWTAGRKKRRRKSFSRSRLRRGSLES